jgi:hypothetical protein
VRESLRTYYVAYRREMTTETTDDIQKAVLFLKVRARQVVCSLTLFLVRSSRTVVLLERSSKINIQIQTVPRYVRSGVK